MVLSGKAKYTCPSISTSENGNEYLWFCQLKTYNQMSCLASQNKNMKDRHCFGIE